MAGRDRVFFFVVSCIACLLIILLLLELNVIKYFTKKDNHVLHSDLKGPLNSTGGEELVIPVFSNGDAFDLRKVQENLPFINQRNCGYSSSRFKITNGNETAPKQFPFMAVLKYEFEDEVIFGCGGSLISDYHILTAAHCIDPHIKSVRLGEQDLSKNIDCDLEETDCIEAQDFEIENIVVHSAYSDIAKQHDIAIIKLKENISEHDLTKYKQTVPVCLPFGNYEPIKEYSDDLLVIGYGVTNVTTKTTSDTLMFTKISKLPIDNCTKYVKKGIQIDDESSLCAGSKTKNTDSCIGDSGGPLFKLSNVNLPDNITKLRYMQYGVVSYGSPKCSSYKPSPAVYTNIAHYKNWILQNL